ncbi:MAG: XrtA system polysaccharide chain length determinant [Burkholderiales bacterium]
MNDFARQALTQAQRVWRHRWLAAAIAWAVAVLGGLVVWFVPERYEAQARIHVDTQTVLKPLMANLAFQPDLDQQVRMLARTLISRPNVERLVKDPNLGLLKDQALGPDVERTTEALTKAIKLEASGGNNLYAISYRDVDMQRARRLVDALVQLFISSGLDSKRRDSQEASRFIDEEIKVYETKLTEAETRLKDFKLRNMSVAMTTNQDYFARMSGLQEDISRLRVQLGAAEQSREAMKRELANENPQLPADSASAVSYTPELDARIDAQRRQLDELLRRYTDEHPDVVAARRTIGQLEAQRRLDGADARSRNAGGRSGAAPTSPVFQRLRIALAEAEANVASLRSQLGTQQVRLEEIRSQAGRVPQAEAELAQLNRDYDVIRKNYEQLVSRREAASMGVKIDQASSMADFRIIEPPRVLPQPVFPSKRQLAVVMMILALLAGIGGAYAKTILAPTFASERELREFTKRPVLGSLTLVEDPKALALERQDRLKLVGVLGLFIVAHAVWVTLIALHTGA